MGGDIRFGNKISQCELGITYPVAPDPGRAKLARETDKSLFQIIVGWGGEPQQSELHQPRSLLPGVGEKAERYTMIEYRIHGRGGQGSVAAAYLLAAAAFEAGFTCQAFPAFGAERRGAPVTAFVRVDAKPITLRSQVQSPDYLIVQDETLLLDPNLTAGLKPGGAMLVNSRNPADEIAKRFNTRVVSIDATAMAMKEIGKPIPNTALLAAFLALTDQMPQSALVAALKGRFRGALLEKNLALIADAASAVEAGAWKEKADA